MALNIELINKMNKILPRCASGHRGERKSAVRQVAKILLPAIEKGQFSAADFRIGHDATRTAITNENIEDILARETAHLKAMIETQKRTITKLEKDKRDPSNGVDVTNYVQRIEQLEHENGELRSAIAAQQHKIPTKSKKKAERHPYEAQNELLINYIDILDPLPMTTEELEQQGKRIWGESWSKDCAYLFQDRDMNNWRVTKSGKIHSHNKSGVPSRFKLLRRIDTAKAAKALTKLQQILSEIARPHQE